jgi:hypothetical protein
MFTKVDAGDGYYLLQNRNTGTCLRVENSSTDNGASIVLDECNSGYWSQQFSSDGLKSVSMLPEESTVIPSDLYAVYPTATSDIVYIKLPETYTNQAHLSVFTSSGALMSNTTLTNGYIDVSSYSNGLYIITIQDNDKTYTHKFIKK